MAEGWSNKPICRYFSHGACHFGGRCRYQHIDMESQHQRPVRAGSSRNASHPETVPGPSSGRGGTLDSSNQGPSRKTSGIAKKEKSTSDSSFTEDWVNAPEFVPAVPKSYVTAANSHSSKKEAPCPHMVDGVCTSAVPQCSYKHSLVCDVCKIACLDPRDVDQQKKHFDRCSKEHDRKMEITIAAARSRDKTCGVCFEVVKEKNPGEQRFGILPNCNHCFCLSCIRKWRQAKQFENKIIRACPECRVTSDFVCPSSFWVDTKEDKDKLIKDYKNALSVKDCKYFKLGRGKCPFGNKCFYLHAYPDGTKADVGPPVRQRRPNTDGDIDVLQQIILWDFLEERESRWLYSIDEVEDLVAFFSDSEDSDWSDYDFFFD